MFAALLGFLLMETTPKKKEALKKKCGYAGPPNENGNISPFLDVGPDWFFGGHKAQLSWRTRFQKMLRPSGEQEASSELEQDSGKLLQTEGETGFIMKDALKTLRKNLAATMGIFEQDLQQGCAEIRANDEVIIETTKTVHEEEASLKRTKDDHVRRAQNFIKSVRTLVNMDASTGNLTDSASHDHEDSGDR
eukprot:g27829.t1